jgi:hypothetical protein
MAKEPIAKAPERRVRRTPVGRRNVLTISGKEPGYEYRIVNDDSDRVQEFLDNGWEVVERDSIRIGDKRIGQGTGEGTAAEVSVGQGMKAFVLRIKEEWYKEDQAAKQAQVTATEAATKADALNGTYGELKISKA